MVMTHHAETTRIDALEVVHHVIARGIEQRGIFSDEKDYRFFIERLMGTVKRSGVTFFHINPRSSLLENEGASGYPNDVS
jgi:hypothetical protein